MEPLRRSARLRVVDVAREEEAIAIACGAHRVGARAALVFENSAYESSGGQRLPAVAVDFVALGRAAAWAAAERLAGAPALADALERGRRAPGPVLLSLATIYDPAKPIPPYSQRPDEVRAKFARALGIP